MNALFYFDRVTPISGTLLTPSIVIGTSRRRHLPSAGGSAAIHRFDCFQAVINLNCIDISSKFGNLSIKLCFFLWAFLMRVSYKSFEEKD